MSDEAPKDPSRLKIFDGKPAEPPLGELNYGYIVTNCNSCWVLIDDRLAICPRCGKKTF